MSKILEKMKLENEEIVINAKTRALGLFQYNNPAGGQMLFLFDNNQSFALQVAPGELPPKRARSLNETVETRILTEEEIKAFAPQAGNILSRVANVWKKKR